jgi:hypothetical protein
MGSGEVDPVKPDPIARFVLDEFPGNPWYV